MKVFLFFLVIFHFTNYAHSEVIGEIDPRNIDIESDTPLVSFNEAKLPVRLRFEFYEGILANKGIEILAGGKTIGKLRESNNIIELDDKTIEIEIPLTTPGDVVFHGDISGKAVWSALIRLQSRVKVEHIQHEAHIDLVSGINGDVISKGFDAIVGIQADTPDGKNLVTCSGFQFAKGIVLTARHCFGDSNTKLKGLPVVVRFGLYYDTKLRENSVIGKVLEDSPVNELDYVVIKLDSIQPNRGILKLSANDIILNNTKLKLIGFWTGGYYEEDKAGIYTNSDEDCQITDDGLKSISSACSYPRFKHRCDAEEGTSGSPLAEEFEEEVIGIHVAGLGGANCAVRSSSIIADLKSKNEWDSDW